MLFLFYFWILSKKTNCIDPAVGKCSFVFKFVFLRLKGAAGIQSHTRLILKSTTIHLATVCWLNAEKKSWLDGVDPSELFWSDHWNIKLESWFRERKETIPMTCLVSVEAFMLTRYLSYCTKQCQLCLSVSDRKYFLKLFNTKAASFFYFLFEKKFHTENVRCVSECISAKAGASHFR